MNNIRVRMAPSPTGYLHIGTARTALFNFLFARKTGGTFVLRIEDTDLERSDSMFERDILDGLRWLGIQWDEGPDIGGPYGPYRQSERLDTYKRHLQTLQEKGFLYECFCTKEELEKEREEQLWSKRPPKYSGKCRNLTEEQKNVFHTEGVASTLRFKVTEKKIKITDLIRGEIEFDTSLIGDVILAKDFDTPLYNFAVVVDDYEMKITHIIRGEDHISNVPKQILLQEALGLETPQFAHLSMILNPDRTKLSKRMNKVSLLEYRDEGYLSEAMVNFMVLLGWNPGGEKELFSLGELQTLFNLDGVHKAGAVFDVVKLDWFNGHYIREKNLDELTDLCMPYLQQAGLVVLSEDECIVGNGMRFNRNGIKKIIALEQGRIRKISEIAEKIGYIFCKELNYDAELLRWKDMSQEEVVDNLRFVYEIIDSIPVEHFEKNLIENTLKDIIKGSGRRNGAVLWPLRVCLTGLEASPGPFEVADVLGKKETLARISVAIERVK
ncbi:MAG: glutamate--tRNA ligase [bacterium]|nr:glutamate--tRNA ligase [bacterium]